jgi:molybdenum cofactor synthesis domain-containing protein
VSISYDLLNKSELRVHGVTLDDADLGELAAGAAEVLELAAREVLVTDYRDGVLTFDVLRPTIYPHQLLDRQTALLARLSATRGVVMAVNASVTADGMLGWIAADAAEVGPAIARAESAATAISQRIARRAVVFSTGGELVSGEVRDTNRATVAAGLEADGFTCDFGGALGDDRDLLAGTLRAWIDRGYGLVITTGGVGAEDKDCTVEAVLVLDPHAATPYTCRFQAGHGRHVKDGIRIAVGRYHGARIFSLPGPNREVAAALEVLRPALASETPIPDGLLAEAIAVRLRTELRAHGGGVGGSNRHHEGAL